MVFLYYVFRLKLWVRDIFKRYPDMCVFSSPVFRCKLHQCRTGFDYCAWQDLINSSAVAFETMTVQSETHRGSEECFSGANRSTCIAWHSVERGSSVVECRTRNQVSPGSNPPLLPFRRLGIFVLSIDALVDSAV